MKGDIMDIYRNTAAYARENGEIQKWRDSKAENIACRDAVDRAVAENFDGAHLKTEEILDNVIAAYGKERVELILAATIQEKAHDGRFSRDNKEWAASVPMPEGEKTYLVSDRTHPILLDALAQEYRVNYSEKKPSVMDKLKQSGSRNEPKICRKSEPER